MVLGARLAKTQMNTSGTLVPLVVQILKQQTVQARTQGAPADKQGGGSFNLEKAFEYCSISSNVSCFVQLHRNAFSEFIVMLFFDELLSLASLLVLSSSNAFAWNVEPCIYTVSS